VDCLNTTWDQIGPLLVNKTILLCTVAILCSHSYN